MTTRLNQREKSVEELVVSNAELEVVFSEIGGINFVNKSVSERASVISDYISTVYLEDEHSRTPIINSLGLIVIKPEAESLTPQVLEFLTDTVGLEILGVQHFKYTLQTYAQVYGEYLQDNNQQVGLLFPALLTGGAIQGLTSIAFRHKTVQEYLDIYAELAGGFFSNTGQLLVDNDQQRAFKKLLVGNGRSCSSHSVRGLIQPSLARLGFASFDTRLARSFDITGELQDRDPNENLITFNGVHTPSRQRDCSTQFQIFFETQGQKEIMTRLHQDI